MPLGLIMDGMAQGVIMDMQWFYSQTITPDAHDLDAEGVLFGRMIALPVVDMGTDARGVVWPDYAHEIKPGFVIVFEPLTCGRGDWTIYRPYSDNDNGIVDRYATVACSESARDMLACLDAVQRLDNLIDIIAACDRITD